MQNRENEILQYSLKKGKNEEKNRQREVSLTE